MRLLIDAALSPLVARELQRSGHDAVHVRDRGMASAPDIDIVALAERENRIIVITADRIRIRRLSGPIP